MAVEPGERAGAKSGRPDPKRGQAPLCSRLAVGAINLEQETHQGKTQPAEQLQVDMDRHPATVTPFAKERVEAGNKQQRREQHSHGVGDHQPE